MILLLLLLLLPPLRVRPNQPRLPHAQHPAQASRPPQATHVACTPPKSQSLSLLSMPSKRNDSSLLGPAALLCLALKRHRRVARCHGTAAMIDPREKRERQPHVRAAVEVVNKDLQRAGVGRGQGHL